MSSVQKRWVARVLKAKLKIYRTLKFSNLISVDFPPRGVLTTYTSLFFKFCPPTLPPTSLSSPTPTTTALSVVIFLLLNGWSRHIWCAILLNYNMDLHMSNLGTLVPEGPWCVFYATRHQIYWALTKDVVFTDTLIWYQTQTHANKHWHTHINIYLHHLLCPHSSYLYYLKWLNEQFTDAKNLLFTMSFLFKN